MHVEPRYEQLDSNRMTMLSIIREYLPGCLESSLYEVTIQRSVMIPCDLVYVIARLGTLYTRLPIHRDTLHCSLLTLYIISTSIYSIFIL